MIRGPVVPAQIDWSDPQAPRAPQFDDVYASRHGALGQAHAIFLTGNGLPERWRQRPRFVMLETGFGLGTTFLSAWQAWRSDPQRPAHLHWLSVDLHPPAADDLRRAHADGPLADLASALADTWPAPRPGLHTLHFDHGAVHLHLALGDVHEALAGVVAQVDAFCLDGFAPDRNPAMWSERLWPALARLAAPGATAATWSAARAVRDGLARAGFDVHRAPGFGGKRHATHAVRPARGPGHSAPGRADAAARLAPDPRVLVVGAGLAGATVARALADAGLQVTVLEGGDAPARGASGNAAGLWHSVAHADDGPHARLLQAAAGHAARAYAPAVVDGTVPGAAEGLLRLDAPAAAPPTRPPVDPTLAQTLDTAAASAAAGLPLPGCGLRFADGGWISPRHWVARCLSHPAITLRTGTPVQALRQDRGGWTALGADAQALADAPVLVLASADDAARLLPGLGVPLARVRGQVTHLRAAAPGAALPRPTLPLAGHGYWIPLTDAAGGGALVGATSQPGDDDPQPRAGDRAHNLARAAALIGTPADTLAAAADPTRPDRVGWRCTAPDRLPLYGPVPWHALDATAPPPQRPPGGGWTQPRHVPRLPGLYTAVALGSRGLTLAPLLADTLAAWITGAPLPLEADLLDAVDPARFTARAARRSGS